MDRIGGSLSLCLVPYLSFPAKAHLGFARIGLDLGFTGVEFCLSLLKLNNEIKSDRLEFYVEIDSIMLDLEHQNRVLWSRVVRYQICFKIMLTNKIVWLLVLWVREVYNPAQTLSGPRARAEEVWCRGQMIDGRGVKGNG